MLRSSRCLLIARTSLPRHATSCAPRTSILRFSTSQPCLRKKLPKSGDSSKQKSPFPFPGFLTSPFKAQEKRSDAWAQRVLTSRVNVFPRSTLMRRNAANMGIRGDLFKDLADQFVKAVLAGKTPGLNYEAVRTVYDSDNGPGSLDRLLLHEFYKFAEPHMPPQAADAYKSLTKLSDLRFPHEWFPEARQMQRKIILHVGPTNSGKTYRALNRLAEAESGIYCGPLRLLAHEIYEKMNAKNIACNLLTGEERREVDPYAPLTSSTVEMATLARRLEVAVVDEIQMIADPFRGWAWTQALLGLQAKEIHLCGEPSIVPLVKSIAEALDEEVIVNEYQRLSPVSVLDKSLENDWSRIRKGDCVIAFSRIQIFEIKDKIEKETGLKCAVVYGALPPETRALQAKHFNDPDSGYDVMIASDAVGMGLNLNIKRVVFSSVVKFDGKAEKFISVSQLKQIAGRAGRFNTAYANGEVTTMRPADLEYVTQVMAMPNVDLDMAGLQPTIDILELFSLQMPDEPLSKLLEKFEDLASLGGKYFLCNYRDQKVLAELIEDVPMPTLRDRYQFVLAPVATRIPECLDALRTMAEHYARNEPMALDHLVRLPEEKTKLGRKLGSLEMSHKIIMLYMWLSLRFPEAFVTPQEEATKVKQECEELIDEGLRQFSTDAKNAKKQNRKSSMTQKRRKRQGPQKDI